MPKLKINREDLIEALTSRFEIVEGQWYLDTETGQVLLDGDGVEDLPEDLHDNPRYRGIDPISSNDAFRIMEDFLATVSDAKAATRLARALEGRKPFRRFKDELLDLPELREAWFQFRDAAYARLAGAWCKNNGIEVEWA
ncbi:MAG TPA: UPF0158 family protein [Methylococcaceae bacterium]|nr:UPF0158 family protein [Methylococcaceae bacterium]